MSHQNGEARHTMRLSAAEAELVHYLRGRAARDYCIAITSLHGAWTVKVATIAKASVSEKVGRSFDEAWRGTPRPTAPQTSTRRFGVILGGRAHGGRNGS